MFYDMLHSPDFLVEDVDSTVDALVSRVGLPRPRDDWYQCFPGHGYKAVFARVRHSRTAAPSRLEVISPHPLPDVVDPAVPRCYPAEMSDLQGDRPVKTHATVVTSSDLPGLVEHVRSKGIRHRIDPPSPELPHERLWIGVSPDDPAGYRPDDDGGLIFEAIPTQCLHLKPSVFDRPPPTAPVADGEMVRIDARCFLVADIDAVVRTLDERLSWPAESATTDPDTGTRRVRLANAIAHGATLELVQPGIDGPEAAFMARFGPGAYAVRIIVAGLPAKADDLRRRGTRFTRRPASGPRPETLRIGPDEVPGALLELVAPS
jgi:hypothetical protein